MEAVRARSLGGPDLWIVAAGAALLYGALVPGLVGDWSRSPDFSHGFFIPVLSVWLLVLRRREIAAIPARPFLPGAALLAVGIVQFLVGVAASEFYLQRSSSVVVLGGLILLLGGPARARRCAFPVLFLLFMIPPPMSIWNTIGFPLQLLASRAAELLLGISGIEAVRSGNVIHLSNCSLEVAGACSGLRSLVTLLALGAILAEGSLVGRSRPQHPVSKLLVFGGAIPVAVGVNSLRVALTAVAASRFGPQAAQGGAHELAGLAMFAVALAALLAWRSALAWIESRVLERSRSS